MAGPMPPVDLRGYEPPVSLWEMVKSKVPEHEHEEIKNILGSSFVEQSLELHEEVSTLLEIWREFRSDNDHMNNTYLRLPEPPAVRERLCQEINFFVQSLREKANDNGRDVMEILTHHKSDVIDYALDSGRPSTASSRPSTARSSRDGGETPLFRGTPTSDRYSDASNISDEVDSMKGKLNYLQFDEVVQRLRNTLEDEVKQLVADIAFLQDCLDDEATWRAESQCSREPTLTDLRGERASLEKELLNSRPVISSPTIPSPPSRPNSGSLGTLPKKPVLPTSASSSKPSSATKGRPGPVRACHSLASQVHTESSRSRTGADVKYNTESNNNGRRTSDRVSSASSVSSNGVSAKAVKVASVRLNSTGDSEGIFTPSPPPQTKPVSRPSSANRFRQMVRSCRDDT